MLEFVVALLIILAVGTIAEWLPALIDIISSFRRSNRP